MPMEFTGRAKGLPSGQVHDLVQDKAGIFWLAGPNGLSRYDGSIIRTLTRKDGLSTHGTRSVAVSTDGDVWVGSDAGLDIVGVDGKIHKLSENWGHGFVECLEAAPDGSMWIGTANGLLLWSEKEGLRAVSDARLLSGMIYSLLLDTEGTLWVAGANAGLLCYTDKEWRHPENNGWETIGNIRALGLGKGTVYAGGDNGLVTLKKDIGDHGIVPIDLDPVTAILEIEDELWVGICGELRIYKEKEGEWLLDQVVLKNSLVNSLRKDSIGNIWCATDTNGLIKISALRKAIIQPALSQQNAILSIRKASNETFLIGGEQQSYRISFKDGMGMQSLPMLNGSKVWDLIEDTQGTLWAATHKGLFKRPDNSKFEFVNGNIPALSSPGRVLHERKNAIWYGTLSGLLKIENGEARQIKGDNGKSLGYVYTISEDRTGRLWVGTLGNGLWAESEGRLKQINSGDLSQTGNVYAIAAHGDGGLAVAQDNKIIFISVKEEAKIITESEHPVSAWALKWLGDKSLLAGSSTGLSEYDILSGQITRHVDTVIEPENWEFTTSRSLFIDDTDNRLICGLSGGLAIIDQTRLDEFLSLPEIKLDSVKWSNTEALRHGNHYSVQTGKWTMEADVYTAWFIDENSLKYRFRLVGFDNLWSQPSSNASVHYNSLPPGNYSLEAQAYTPLFGWGQAEKVMDIRVDSPWWARGIFSLPYAAADAFFGLVESRRRNNELLERNMELEFYVKERTQEIEEANRNLQELNAKLQQISSMDSLTGIANRRYFDEVFDRELERARRSESPISLILADVDYFKAYNDKYGHQQGDKCLKAVALAMGMSLRESGDLVARYGGEEFIIVLPYTSTEEALATAERLRNTVESLRIPHCDSPTNDFVTISLGIASGNFSRKNSISDIKQAKDELIAAADKSLYRAKAKGRNRAETDEEIFRIGETHAGLSAIPKEPRNETIKHGM